MSLRVLAVAVSAVSVPMVLVSIRPLASTVPPPSLSSAVGPAINAGAGSMARRAPAPPVTADQTVQAEGFVVHRSIAGHVRAMVLAASAEGVTLTGSGYRSRDQQAALRRNNGCPDVDVSPSSACRVPTARPGRSQHEAGLALDFRNCSTRETPCHRWLVSNAAQYGFYNFPAEPWHWSTSGL